MPSSHLVKTRMKVWNIETPPSVMKFFSFVMKKISGGKGDCFFFFNRTWHGRSPNYYDKYNDVILISFFPESACFEIDSWDTDFLKSINGSTFYNLININKVKSSKDESSCNSFALKIEKNEVENTFLNKFKLFITTLRFLFKIYRTLKKVISFRWILMRVLVTGSNGFIGSHLVEKLIQHGFSVRAFVNYNSLNSIGWLDNVSQEVLSNCEIFYGDIRDSNAVYEAMKNCDIILHLAALISIPYSYYSPDMYVETNVKGTLNILQAAKKTGRKKSNPYINK